MFLSANCTNGTDLGKDVMKGDDGQMRSVPCAVDMGRTIISRPVIK